MDTWSAKCQSCDVEYKVKASSEAEAIAAAKAAHDLANAEAMAFRCDFGPFITHAFNLTHPEHHCAPREW